MEKPLFEAAVDHGNAIQLMNETAQLEKILEDNPDFDKLMKHPGIPKQEKLSMVEQVFRGRVSDDLTEFLKIVVTKERYGSLKAIFAYFTELVRESEGDGNRICKYCSGADGGPEAGSEKISCWLRLPIRPLMCITMWIRR